MTEATGVRLDGLPEPPAGLGESQLREWHSMRRRAGRRHEQWRRSLPAIEVLFDDESHRAKALAGNLATELGDVLRGTVQIAPAAILDRGRPADWLLASCRGWRGGLRGAELVGEAGDEAVELFDAMLAQLIDRERDRALALAREAATATPAGPAALRRLARLLASPLQRFFRPS